MADRSLGERVMELEGLVDVLTTRVLVLEGEKDKRKAWVKQGVMVKNEHGKWVRKPPGEEGGA